MRNPWKLTSLALTAALIACVGSGAVNRAGADPQPVMRDALDQLRGAAHTLEAGAHDKGGHRVKALEYTRAAIREVEAGIKFDNRH